MNENWKRSQLPLAIWQFNDKVLTSSHGNGCGRVTIFDNAENHTGYGLNRTCVAVYEARMRTRTPDTTRTQLII